MYFHKLSQKSLAVHGPQKLSSLLFMVYSKEQYWHNNRSWTNRRQSSCSMVHFGFLTY